MMLFDGAEGVVVDVDDAFGPEPNAAATDAPTTARKARETSARFVRVAGLAPLAMTALRCGTQPVTDAAHSARDEHESERIATGKDGQETCNEDSRHSDASMDAVLRVSHVENGSRADWSGVVREDEFSP